MYLSIVIPAYNEGKRIHSTLKRIKEYLRVKPFDFEIIVVDDGSNDNTREVAKHELYGLNYKLLENGKNRGKGFSVRRGMLEASGDLVLFSDADLSTPIEEFDKLESSLKDGYDLAIASRVLKDSNVEIHQNWLREYMGKTFYFFATLLAFGKAIKDSQCGFKCFRRDVAREIFSEQKIDGFCFDAEIIYLAQKKGCRVKEIPVTWRDSPKSKVNIVFDSLRMLGDLFRIRLLHCKWLRRNKQ